MSFNRLVPDDFVVSTDSITATLWSGGIPTLTTFFTSSVQEAGSSGDYYLNVFQSDPQTSSTASIQFAIAYGNINGGGTTLYNDDVPGLSPSRTVYGQFINLLLVEILFILYQSLLLPLLFFFDSATASKIVRAITKKKNSTFPITL